MLHPQIYKIFTFTLLLFISFLISVIKGQKMLYLEDYLEMIEHLPMELRDRFTGIREMDLSVQSKCH